MDAISTVLKWVGGIVIMLALVVLGINIRKWNKSGGKK